MNINEDTHTSEGTETDFEQHVKAFQSFDPIELVDDDSDDLLAAFTGAL